MRLRFLFLLLAGLLTPVVGFGDEEITIGGQPLRIPIPAGFIRLTGVSPTMDENMARMVPPTNRLLLTIAEPGAVAEIKNGNPAYLNHYFGVQTNRETENRTISLAEFKDECAKMEEQVGAGKDGVPSVEKQVQEQLRNSNLPMELRVGEMRMLGVFEKTERSLDFGMLAKTQVGFEEVQPVAMTASILLVRNKVLFLYIYSLYHSKADIDWTRNTAKSWRESILAANLETGAAAATGNSSSEQFSGAKKSGIFHLQGVALNALIGGIGGVVGVLLVVLWRKKRALPPPPPPPPPA